MEKSPCACDRKLRWIRMLSLMDSAKRTYFATNRGFYTLAEDKESVGSGRLVAMVTASELRKPSFWSLQAAGWFCFLLLSTLVVFPYLWKPGEFGYQSSKALFLDQGLMCFLCFVASLSLRPVCRDLLQRSLSWITLEIWTAVCSVVVGTLTAL